MKSSVTFPDGFHALKHDGYFFRQDDGAIYSIKSGILKKMKTHRYYPRWMFNSNHLNKARSKTPYYALSVRGRRVFVFTDELQTHFCIPKTIAIESEKTTMPGPMSPIPMRSALSKEESWRSVFRQYTGSHTFIDNPEMFGMLKNVHDQAWDQAVYTYNNAER